MAGLYDPSPFTTLPSGPPVFPQGMDLGLSPQPAAPQPSNALVAGLKSGAYGALGQLSAAGQGAASAAGLPTLASALQGFSQRQQQNAQAAGRRDLEYGPGDDQAKWYSPTAALYHLAQGLPMMGAAVGAGLAAEPLGVLGAGAAAATATYPFLFGSNVQDLEHAHGQLAPGDLGKAAGYAVPEAAIGAFAPTRLAGLIERGIPGQITKRVIGEGMANAGLMGAGNAVNTALGQQMVHPDMPFSERAPSIIESFLQGSVQGGILGGALGAMRPQRQPTVDPNVSTPELDAATRSVDPQYDQSGQAVMPGLVPEPERPVEASPLPQPDAPAPTEVQGDLGFTPAETGERAGQVDQARQLLVDQFKIPKNVDLSSFDATTPAETVNWLRDQVAARDEAGKGLPKWLKQLGDAFGVTDTTGGERDLASELADLQQQHDDLLAKASKNRDNKQGQVFLDKALQIQNEAMPRLQKLLDAHAEADQLREAAQPPEPAPEPAPAPAEPLQLTYAPDREAPSGPPLFADTRGNVGESPYATDIARQTDSRGNTPARLRPTWDLLRPVIEGGDEVTAAKARAAQQALEADAPGAKQQAMSVARQFAEAQRARARSKRPSGQEAADVTGGQETGVGAEPAAADSTPAAPAGAPAARTQIIQPEGPTPAAEAIAPKVKGEQPTAAEALGTNLSDNDNARPTAPAAAAVLGDNLSPQPAQPRAKKGAAPKIDPVALAQRALQRVNDRAAAGDMTEREANDARTYWQNEIDRLGKESATITSGPRTQTDVDLEHIITQGGTGRHVLDYLSQHVADPAMRELATHLQKLGINPKIEMARPDGLTFDNERAKPGTVTASINPSLDRVNIYDRANMGQSLLHEMVHAATLKALRAGGTAAREMNRLYEAVKARSPEEGAYGLSGSKDFVAEAFTNPQFRDFLRGQLVDTGSFLGNAWQAFKNAVYRAVGAPERARTMLDQVLEGGHRLMDENQRAATVPDTNARSIETARVADSFRDGLVDKVLKAASPKETGVQWFKRVLYFTDRNGIVENLKHIMPSLVGWRDAEHLHTMLGSAHATTFLHATEQLRGLRDKLGPKLYDQFTRDYQTMGQLGVDERGWDINTQVHNHPNAKDLRGELDGIANRFNSVYRQKGALPVYQALRALGEMDNAAHLYRGLARHLDDLHPGKVELGADPSIAFAQGTDRTTQGGAAHYMGALKDLVARTEAYIRPLRGEAQALNKTSPRRLALEAEIAPLENHLAFIKSELDGMAAAPYTPNRRFGNYFVSMHLLPGEKGGLAPKAVARLQELLTQKGYTDIGVNQHTENPSVFMRTDTADRAQGLRDIADQLKAEKLLDPENDKPRSGDLTEGDNLRHVAPGWLRQMIAKVAASNDFATPEQKAKVQDQMRQLLLEVMPQRTLVRMGRTDAQGFSTDLHRSFAQRAQISANAIAHLTSAPHVDAALGAMKAEADALKSKSNVVDQVRAQAIYNEISERLANRQILPQHSFLDTARTFTHTWFLGVSPAYFALELSQIPMFVVPAMARTHGFAASYRAIARTLPMTMKVVRAVMDGGLGKYAIMTPEGLRKAGIPPAVADFLVQVNNRGWFENSATRELGMYADGRMNTAQKAMHWANIAALYTELASHVNTALAVRELHGAKEHPDGLHAFVDDVMSRGQWNWGPGETARAFGKQGFAGKYTPNVVQFSSWQAKAIARLYTELHDVFSKGATPEQRKQAATFLMGHFATAAILSGTLGLPLAQTMMGLGSKLANTLTGSDQWDLENGYRGFLNQMFGKDWGEAVARGLPHLAGIDLSEMGDAGLVPFGRFLADQRKWEDAAKDWSWHSIGSSIGLAANIYKGFRDFAMGDTLNGLKELMPTSLKNPFEAYLMSEHGYENRSGVKAPVQPSGSDVFMKAMGIEPASLVRNEDLQEQVERTRDNRAYVSSYLRGNLLRAAAHNDQAGYQSAVQDLIAFARQHPGTLVNPGALISQQRRESALAQALGMPAGTGLRDQYARQRIQNLIGQ